MRIRKVLSKETRNQINKINAKTKISKLKLYLDVFVSLKKYKCTTSEYFYYEFYNLNDKERKTFITNHYNDEIINKYNNKNKYYILLDKGEFNRYYSDLIGRKFIDLRTASFKDFKEFITGKDKVLASSIDYNKFEKIIINKELLKNEYNVLKVYNNVMKKSEVIIEEILTQNEVLTNIYSEGINYLRINTFLKDNEVYILSKVLKINKSNDEKLYAIVSDNAKIEYPTFNNKGVSYLKHPDTNFVLNNLEIPYYNEVIRLVKEASSRLKDIKYVGFDILITDKGPVLLKATPRPLIFELKPSIGVKRGTKELYKRIVNI